MGSMYAIWTPVTCWAVAWSLKVRMLMTAKSARKSPKTEMVWAYQSRRIMGMRMTSPIESGAGISGSMDGFGIDSVGAGLEEVVLMRGELMVPERGVEFRCFVQDSGVSKFGIDFAGSDIFSLPRSRHIGTNL
jgi:hypothetical protein